MTDPSKNTTTIGRFRSFVGAEPPRKDDSCKFAPSGYYGSQWIWVPVSVFSIATGGLLTREQFAVIVMDLTFKFLSQVDGLAVTFNGTPSAPGYGVWVKRGEIASNLGSQAEEAFRADEKKEAAREAREKTAKAQAALVKKMLAAGFTDEVLYRKHLAELKMQEFRVQQTDKRMKIIADLKLAVSKLDNVAGRLAEDVMDKNYIIQIREATKSMDTAATSYRDLLARRTNIEATLNGVPKKNKKEKGK